MDSTDKTEYTRLIRSCETQEQIDNMEVAIERRYGFIPEVLGIVMSNQRAIIFSDNAAK